MILPVIAEALRDDSILNDWCMSNLGALPNIMIGIDEFSPPEKDSYPLVVMSDIETSGEGMDSNYVTYSIPVSCGVINDEVSVSGRIVTYSGMIQCELFRVQVAEALQRNFQKIKAVIKVDANAASIAAHPLYVSTMAVDFRTRK